MKKTVILEDLDCAHCAGKIEEAVNELKDVEKCSVNFLTQIVKKIEPDVTFTVK